MTLDQASSDALRELGYEWTPELEEVLVAQQAEDLEWLAKVERQYPLASSVLWRAEAAECDQRRSVEAVMRAPTVGLVLGGERSGKSRGLKELTIAMALGGDHPMVAEWLRLNALPRDVIPDGPAEVYAVAQTSGDSLRYHRSDFDRLAPRIGKRWYNKNGKGEAELQLHVAGYEQPGKIWFKSVDQGARSMQGATLRWAWIDEEPLGHDGLEVYGQLRARVADQDGRVGISMVPMEGYTWVYDRLVQAREDGAVVLNLNTMDNPHLPKKRFERHFEGMSDEERDQRQFGRFRSRTGTVYPKWNPSNGERFGTSHVCRPFDIPADWPIFRGGDFGLVNPTAIGWGALGDDGTIYLIREWYKGDNDSYDEVAAAVRTHDLSYKVLKGWGDPAALEAREKFARHGMPMELANHDLGTGYDRMRDRMRLQGDNRPRLKVFSTCPYTIREVGGLMWDPHRVDRVQLKKDDHAADMLRYLVVGIDEWLAGRAANEAVRRGTAKWLDGYGRR